MKEVNKKYTSYLTTFRRHHALSVLMSIFILMDLGRSLFKRGTELNQPTPAQPALARSDGAAPPIA